jgi:hypothetical protein
MGGGRLRPFVHLRLLGADRFTLPQKGILMGQNRIMAGFFCISLAVMASLSTLVANHFSEPFPPLSISLSSPVSPLSDFIGISMGFRKATADIAWIETLVYYGTHEQGAGEEVADTGGGNYPLFLSYCQRVARIDPSFKYVFYYGGGVLGWNLNRQNEAEELLREGIKQHPKEWRYQQFLAGLAYEKNHDINALADFLKGFVEDKDCPNLLRSILANIYKKQKRYKEAIYVWTLVHDTGDPNYLRRSESQIKEMLAIPSEMGHKAH